MIKVHKNDSIVDIIIKIKNNNEKDVVLEFPFWHPVLHNYTSLKILKNKADKKELIIITNDKTAKKIWKSLGIKYSIVDNPDIVWYNYTFWEYLIYTFKSYFREFRDIFLRKWWKDGKKYYDSKIWYFITTLFICFILLIFIFYFAVNKTYIYITPKIEVKSKAKNFIFTEMNEDNFIIEDNIIRLRKIEKTISITEKFWTSWISSDTVSNARWKITLFNETDSKVDLIENTRIQTDEGIVFLIEWSVSVPAAEASWTGWVLPWTIDIYVKSRNLDIDWLISWTRANIWEWVQMFLPWLKENRDKIYAISSNEFSWANDNFKRVITEEDIENARALLKWKIEWEALKTVRAELEAENKLNNVQYEILWINDIIKYTDFEVYWLENYEIWQVMDNFELSWTIKIQTYAYNKWLLISKMRWDIANSILTNIEEILEVDESSLRITNILSVQDTPFSIKATAIVQVYVIHNFLSKSNTYVERLKAVVAWLEKEEAEKILLNNNKISNVKIEIKPFFIWNVSKINENIILKVVR